MNELILKRPDDWHIHLRSGSTLVRTVKDAAQMFNRVVVMPNLVPPVKDVVQAIAYRAEILSYLDNNQNFNPLMTFYLSEETQLKDLISAKKYGVVAGKLYPRGATTNSEFGVKDIQALYPIFEVMAQEGLLLLLHGEVTDPTTDIFDREQIFIDSILMQLLKDFPKLKIVLEHITTAHAVQAVKDGPETLAATITAHHLWLNRNDLLSGGIKPHHYCLPVLKRESDRLALIDAATSGHPRFFIGTDSAPHTQEKKEAACGCAGIYTAYHALSLYAQIFEECNALDKLEKFTSVFGAEFYEIPINQDTVTLINLPWVVPEKLPMGNSFVIPFAAGQTLEWRLK